LGGFEIGTSLNLSLMKTAASRVEHVRYLILASSAVQPLAVRFPPSQDTVEPWVEDVGGRHVCARRRSQQHLNNIGMYIYRKIQPFLSDQT
jgi:hypothetical protein